ncbi:hypothetical protein FJT64_020502 [Amphibalanus amphitrite]|uniref:Uncharacterized protein n=1 Tax=Amphibalanus amphitrite TaxID=1232801 RepID=A0A6A4WSK9_AMPAM|nr:hypothetical protein FJT64_020502 [Amphibalanus amphitrite]
MHQSLSSMSGLLSSSVPPPPNVTLNASAAKTAYLLAVHEESRVYAVIYVSIVLVCYTVGMSVLLTRHFRRAENQPRLAVLYQAIINRTASLRRRRTDEAPRAAPQVVVHEPEVSPAPLRGASERPSAGGARQNGRQVSSLDEITTDVDVEACDGSVVERTTGRVYRETDF